MSGIPLPNAPRPAASGETVPQGTESVPVTAKSGIPWYVWVLVVGVGYTLYTGVTSTMPAVLNSVVGGVFEVVGTSVLSLTLRNGQVMALPAGAAVTAIFCVGAFFGGWIVSRRRK